MKEIRIFIASSKELQQERDYLAYLTLANEEAFEKRGFRVRLSKWEYVDPKMTVSRTEDRYLEEMFNSDLALVIFKNLVGKYTREELDKAQTRVRAGKGRLKACKILFCSDGASDSDAGLLRAAMAEGSYGIYLSKEELKAAFLGLVDEIAATDRLEELSPEDVREVSAFLAADDELAADRNAFADTILNLNDILMRRGFRVKMRFYDPERHRELLETSEMALVLYDTKCGEFGPDRMQEAYDRTVREENPKRLYVFFRDEDESKLGRDFVEFRNSFAENLGHFFCRFENADTLKLNFLLSLESALGEGARFVKLEGKKVKADELEVGEITKLPMVANNGGLNELLAQTDQIAEQFERQQRVCRENPEDSVAYRELLELSVKKNDLEGRASKELSRSFDLAKRMAVVSAKEANETICRARSLLDHGRIDDAVQLLDGASSEIDDVLGEISDLDDLMEQKLKTLEAWIDVELFRCDTILAFAKEPFHFRFSKVEKIYRALLKKSEKVLVRSRPKILADVLVRFAELYDEVDDTLSPIPLLEKVRGLYQMVENSESGLCALDRAEVCLQLAQVQIANNRLSDALENLDIALAAYRQSPKHCAPQISRCLSKLGELYESLNRLGDAEKAFAESLEIRRRLAAECPGRFDSLVATGLQDLAIFHRAVNRLPESECEYREALPIRRRLAKDDPAAYEGGLALMLNNMGNLFVDLEKFDEAENAFRESVLIYRRLAVSNPARFDGRVAMALTNWASLHLTMDVRRLDDVKKMLAEGLEIYRRLSSVNPERFDCDLAHSLELMALLHRRANELKDAENRYSEALEIARRLAKENPEKFEGDVARVLSNMGNALLDMDRWSEAEAMFTESLMTYRRNAKVNPSRYEVRVASALCNMGRLFQKQKRLEEAEKVLTGALEIYRRLSGMEHERYDFEVASSLKSLASLHDELNRPADAERERAEAFEISRRIYENDSVKLPVRSGRLVGKKVKILQ